MNKEKLNRIIELLNQVENDDSIKNYRKDEGPNGKFIPDDVLPKELIDLIYGELCECPYPDYKKREYMTDHGYHVYAGEKDSFSWLTGCISTKKGVIVFG